MMKTVIYPYTQGILSYMPYIETIGYDVVGLVGGSEHATFGKDAGRTFGDKEIGIKVISKDKVSSIEFDTLILTENAIKIDWKSFVQDNTNIENVILLSADKEFYTELKRFANNLNIKTQHAYTSIDLTNIDETTIQDIEIPIIYCFGQTDNNNQADIHVALHQAFKEKGFKPVSLSCDANASLFGFYNFDKLFNIAEKRELIHSYNSILHNLSLTDNPDLIIVTIPGESLPFNKKITENFGLNTYYMSLAATPDYVIYTTAFGEYESEFTDEFYKLFYYRFGFNINAWYMGKQLIDWNASKEKKSLVTKQIDYYLQQTMLKENIERDSHFMSIDDIVGHAVKTLSEDNIVEFV